MSTGVEVDEPNLIYDQRGWQDDRTEDHGIECGTNTEELINLFVVTSQSAEGFLGNYKETIEPILSKIILFLETVFSILFKCNYNYAEEEDYTEEKEDWSAILIFIMIVKCRTSIGKILDFDEDD